MVDELKDPRFPPDHQQNAESSPEPEPCPICGGNHKIGSGISDAHRAEYKAKLVARVTTG